MVRWQIESTFGFYEVNESVDDPASDPEVVAEREYFLQSHQAGSRVLKLQRMRQLAGARLQAWIQGGLQALCCRTAYKKPSKSQSGGNFSEAQYLDWCLRAWFWKYFTASLNVKSNLGFRG